MAAKIPDGAIFRRTSFDSMDGASSFSWHIRFKLDTLSSTRKQYIFSLRANDGNQISFRKMTGGTDTWRFSATVGGVNRVLDRTTTIFADTIYDFSGTWLLNDAAGMKLYEGGTQEVTTVDTTPQGDSFSTSGTGNMYLSLRHDTGDDGLATIERFVLWKNVVLTQGQIRALSDGASPHQIGVNRPALWWQCWLRSSIDDPLQCPDFSGNGWKVTGSDLVGVTGVGTLGVGLGGLEDPDAGSGGYHRGAAGGATPPNPWVLDQTVLQPTAAATVAGLSNGTTYEFRIRALDQSGNVSLPSDVVEATPAAPGAPAVVAPRPWRRRRRFTKYRVSQQ